MVGLLAQGEGQSVLNVSDQALSLVGHLLVFAKSIKALGLLPTQDRKDQNFAVLWDEGTIFHQTLFLRKYVRKQPRKRGEQLSLHVSSLLLAGSRNGWVYFTSGLLMLHLPYRVSL